MTIAETDVMPPGYDYEPLIETLDRIVAFNKKFVHHKNDSSHDLIALWIATTYGMPVWDWHGRLYITSPQKGAGKSTQGEIISLLTSPSIESASTSAPAAFRAIDEYQPCLILDEADNQFGAEGGKDAKDLSSLLNRGYKQGGYILRSEDGQMRKFAIYSAVCIIGIENGRIPAATRSRCIPVQMGKVKKPSVIRYRPRQHESFQHEIATRLGTAALDFKIVDSPIGRNNDIWEAILSVAHLAGPEWVKRAEAANAAHQWVFEDDTSVNLLSGIKGWCDDNADAERVQSRVLVEYLNEDPSQPTWTQKSLALTLKAYGLSTTRSTGGNYVYNRRDIDQVLAEWR